VYEKINQLKTQRQTAAFKARENVGRIANCGSSAAEFAEETLILIVLCTQWQ